MDGFLHKFKRYEVSADPESGRITFRAGHYIADITEEAFQKVTESLYRNGRKRMLVDGKNVLIGLEEA